MKPVVYFVPTLLLTAILAACSPPSTPTTTPEPSPTAQPPLPAGTTYGKLAQEGKPVYASDCGGCHGVNGQGVTASATWGPKANLAKYGNAKALLDYTESHMPTTAPGNITHQGYVEITAYLLLQDDDVTTDTPFDESQLSNLLLK